MPVVGVAILGVALTCVLLSLRETKRTVRQVQCQEETKGRWSVKDGKSQLFQFAGFGDRVFVPNAPEFNPGASQNFSIEAWIKAYPAASKSAKRVTAWLNARPKSSRFVPKELAAWIADRAADNGFGVMPIVDKHQPRSTIEAVGFQLYLDHGRLACQLAAPPMRPLGFQNFVSPAPNLHDGRWHHVAVTVERNSPTGGRLYLDGQPVLTFDPTKQTGDLPTRNRCGLVITPTRPSSASSKAQLRASRSTTVRSRLRELLQVTALAGHSTNGPNGKSRDRIRGVTSPSPLARQRQLHEAPAGASGIVLCRRIAPR